MIRPPHRDEKWDRAFKDAIRHLEWSRGTLYVVVVIPMVALFIGGAVLGFNPVLFWGTLCLVSAYFVLGLVATLLYYGTAGEKILQQWYREFEQLPPKAEPVSTPTAEPERQPSPTVSITTGIVNRDRGTHYPSERILLAVTNKSAAAIQARAQLSIFGNSYVLDVDGEAEKPGKTFSVPWDSGGGSTQCIEPGTTRHLLIAEAGYYANSNEFRAWSKVATLDGYSRRFITGPSFTSSGHRGRGPGTRKVDRGDWLLRVRIYTEPPLPELWSRFYRINLTGSGVPFLEEVKRE